MRDGLVTLPSPCRPQETLRRLVEVVTGKGLLIFATIDHAQAARQAGLWLKPASLVIFGSPNAGTPLMQLAPTLAIDLPLKALVWEDEEGETWLSYNEPTWLAHRHSLAAHDAPSLGWESEGGAIEPDLDSPFVAEAHHGLGPAADALLNGMAHTLAEIAHMVLRPDETS